jgi:hypothetical protein
VDKEGDGVKVRGSVCHLLQVLRTIRMTLAGFGCNTAADSAVARAVVPSWEARPFQFIQTRDRIVQFFEWFRIWREIWTDGRKMPEDPGRRFYGYSVANWDGDTLEVETFGLDPRL